MADVIRVPGGYRMTGPWTQEKQDAVTVGSHLVSMASRRRLGDDLGSHATRCSACRGDAAGVEAAGYVVGDDLRRMLTEQHELVTGSSPRQEG